MPSALSPVLVSGPNKQPYVIAALTNLARELGPGGRLPTAKDLTKSLAITKATLSKSLAHLESRGILRCIQGSGIYVADGILQKRVALVFGGNIFTPSGSEYGRLFLQHSSRLANSDNLRLSFYLDLADLSGAPLTPDTMIHKDLVEALNDDKIDGIILMGRNSPEQEIWLRSQGVPVVGTCPDGTSRSEKHHAVLVDHDQLLSIGLDNLLRHDAKRIGLISPRKLDHLKFDALMKARGLDCRPEWICQPPRGEDSPVETRERLGRALAAQWLAASGWDSDAADKPDSLLIPDDILCKGVLTHFTQRGIKPGKDITVCSHANKGSFVLNEWEHDLLRVECDPQEMAAATFAMLEDLMEGKPCDPEVVLIPPHKVP